MGQGSWLNQDGLMIQFGTQKANPEQGGDYQMPGADRVAEVLIDLTSLGTTAQVQSLTTYFPAGYNTFIDKVEVINDVQGVTGTGSLSVGLGYFSGSTYANITTNTEASTASGLTVNTYTASVPGITSISDTAFVDAMIDTVLTDAAGQTTELTGGSTYAGAYIGAQSTTTTYPNYITAKLSSIGTAYTAGLVRVRIFYRGYGTIIN